MPPNACRCERARSQLCAAAGPSCEDVGPGMPRFQWESLDMAAAAKNKMSPLLHILFHASSKLRFQENSLAWMCSLSFPQDESGHACSHRSTVPTSGSRSCARCHGNRHLFASAEAPSRTGAGPKRRKPLPHLLLWSRGEGLTATVMERPPSFPPLPPRNCLSVQFLPHVSTSHPSPSICSWTAFPPAAILPQRLHLAAANFCQHPCVIYTGAAMTSPASNESQHIQFSLASCSLVYLL